MNTKVLFAAVITVLVAVGGIVFFLRSASAPVPTSTSMEPAASTTPLTTQSKPHSEPTFKFGTTTTKAVPAFALFDASSFTSTSTYPTVTGIANTPKVGIIINNSAAVGVLGTWEIPVINGHWSYSSSVALVPGTYTLVLFAGNNLAGNAKLIVR